MRIPTLTPRIHDGTIKVTHNEYLMLIGTIRAHHMSGFPMRGIIRMRIQMVLRDIIHIPALWSPYRILCFPLYYAHWQKNMARCGYLLHSNDNGNANNLLFRLMTQRIVVLGRKVRKEMMAGSFYLYLTTLTRRKKVKLSGADNPKNAKGTCFRSRYSL